MNNLKETISALENQNESLKLNQDSLLDQIVSDFIIYRTALNVGHY